MSDSNNDPVDAAIQSFGGVRQIAITQDTKESQAQQCVARITHHADEFCAGDTRALLTPILDALNLGLECPASSALCYHGAFYGGLVSHIDDVLTIALEARKSLDTVRRLVGLKDKLYNQERRLAIPDGLQDTSPASIVRVAILHDLNKLMDTNGKRPYIPNALKGGEVSTARPYKHNPEHDELSGVKVNGNQAVTDAGAAIFNYGGLQYASGAASLQVAEHLSPGIISTLSDAELQAVIFHGGMYERCDRTGFLGKESALTVLLHFADMIASRVFT